MLSLQLSQLSSAQVLLLLGGCLEALPGQLPTAEVNEHVTCTLLLPRAGVG